MYILEQRKCYCPGSSEEQTIFLKNGYIWFRMHLEFWKNHKEYRQIHTFLAYTKSKFKDKNCE